VNEFQTSDIALLENKDYIKVRNAVYLLIDSGFNVKYTGFCIDSSRMVMAMLAQFGIKSHLQQCCALLTRGDKVKQLYAIGFHEDIKPGVIDTHFVTITETDTPLLIDMSLGQLLLNEEKIILERAENEMILGNYTHTDYKLTYIRK
jgi:hypothetical protein